MENDKISLSETLELMEEEGLVIARVLDRSPDKITVEFIKEDGN